jgi:meso-butanediol dehydrogenase/(S,S)-butanediol dehydrogenase/diacetyl reductase
MNQRLEGKAAVITGGGAGIGAAVGGLFCTEGAGVMLVDADADAITQKVEQIRQQVAGVRVTSFVTDVADAAQALQAVERALDEFGRLDVMVNNAAMHFA